MPQVPRRLLSMICLLFCVSFVSWSMDTAGPDYHVVRFWNTWDTLLV